jgi:2-C-methyl-D-erythritol 4-phosphate cytidylyltransferase/2-C-methyl-D-erythritol 2,4-cyclodiphosphate synthase
LPTTYVIIPAAGQGRRMGGPIAKQFLPIHDIPLLVWTVRAFTTHPDISGIVVAVAPDTVEHVRALLTHYQCMERVRLVIGGDNRQTSVANAVQVLPVECDVVLVHDAARPVVSAELISRVAAAAVHGCVSAAVPMQETVKVVDGDTVQRTLDRSQLWSIQTPQGFPRSVLAQAHQTMGNGQLFTDDCALAEALGHTVRIVQGDPQNLKVTTPADLPIVELFLAPQEEPPTFPGVGMGYDVHRLVEGRALVLGGVTIPYQYGLLGHSDADVLLHAVMDALLGAAGLGDIGHHFPDSKPEYAGASSLVLLLQVYKLLSERCLQPCGVDVVLIAEKPKIAPYVQQMRVNIATALSLPPSAVNVKATTNEAMGFVGRKEGMAAQAVARVRRVRESK